MELVKDYDFDINYHLGKANVVADALNRKSFSCLKALRQLEKSLKVRYRADHRKLVNHDVEIHFIG